MATKWGFPDLIEEEDENTEEKMLDKIKDQTKKEVLLGEQSEKQNIDQVGRLIFPLTL